ncbi:hypothetical protein H4R33_006682 [Dimargaris cristalligena]|nr:hypothetical protein H4R33_006682 [Dimargaris cristalligena]
MDASFFRGTNAEQDPRFSDKQKKLRKTTEFPAEFNTKVNLRKVNMTVIRPWVTQQITEHLGFEDEVVIEFVLGMLEENSPDPKDMQINLTGFLSRKAPVFVLDLWKLLISAQNSLGGIPPEFLEQKKREILNKKAESERIQAQITQKQGDLSQQQADFRQRAEQLAAQMKAKYVNENKEATPAQSSPSIRSPTPPPRSLDESLERLDRQQCRSHHQSSPTRERRSHRDRRTSENRRDHSRTRTHDHSRSRSRSPRRR